MYIGVTSISSTQTSFLWASSHFCQYSGIALAEVTCKIHTQDQNLNVLLELLLSGQLREVCTSSHQFRSAGGVWGTWLYAIITETQYLIFLKELSHGFKNPIQALLHTPALNTQRCVLHIYTFVIFSASYPTHTSRKYPAGTSTRVWKPDPGAGWHHSREVNLHRLRTWPIFTCLTQGTL